MSEAWDFSDIELGGLLEKKARQDIDTGVLDQQKKVNDLRLARQAMEDAEAIRKDMEGLPDLANRMGKEPAAVGAEVADILIRHGKIEAGAKILADFNKAGESAMKAARANLQNQITANEHLGAGLASVEGKTGAEARAAWEAAFFGMMANFPEDTSPEEHAELVHLASLPDGDEENFDYAGAARAIRASSVTEIQRAQRELSEASAQHNKQMDLESRLRMRDLIPAQADLAKAKAENERKYGGTSNKRKVATISAAKALIATEYDIVTSPAMVEVRAGEIAERAEDILLERPNMGRTAALKEAYKDAKDDNKFAGLDLVTEALGSSAKAPLEMPPIEDGRINPENMESNKFYQIPPALGGGVAVWDEKKKKLVRVKAQP